MRWLWTAFPFRMTYASLHRVYSLTPAAQNARLIELILLLVLQSKIVLRRPPSTVASIPTTSKSVSTSHTGADRGPIVMTEKEITDEDRAKALAVFLARHKLQQAKESSGERRWPS